MRVHVFKGDNGLLSVLLEPSIGKGLAPVAIPFQGKAELKGKVLSEIRKMRGELTPSDDAR